MWIGLFLIRKTNVHQEDHIYKLCIACTHDDTYPTRIYINKYEKNLYVFMMEKYLNLFDFKDVYILTGQIQLQQMVLLTDC